MTDLLPPGDRPAGPVSESERIRALDVVRGFAVLGILVMNVVEFGLPMRAYDNPAYAGGSDGGDLWTWFVQVALFDGKMRALFSMLFGAGIVLLGERMERAGRGGEAADLLLRRCLWLVPFGIVHRFLLQWTGDILYMYGLLGLIAIAFRKLSAGTLVVAGVLALGAAVPIAGWHHYQAVSTRADAAAADELAGAGREVPAELQQARTRWERRLASVPPKPEAVQEEIDAIRGGYASVFAHRWDHHHSFQSAFIYYFFVWDVLGMMLLGMGLQRLGFFAGRCSLRVYCGLLGAGGAAALLSFWWATAWADTGFSPGALGLRLVHDVGYPFARGLVGLAWGSALILLVRAGRAAALTAPLAAVGRMAFTNYVLQTVCCTLFFFGYGLGNYGRLARAETMLVWLGVTAVQVTASLLWLRSFRFGPLEWAWRSLTYWRRQPFRRAAAPAADPT